MRKYVPSTSWDVTLEAQVPLMARRQHLLTVVPIALAMPTSAKPKVFHGRSLDNDTTHCENRAGRIRSANSILGMLQEKKGLTDTRLECKPQRGN